MTNRLSNASSPYLRQHQNNPVDWYPWNKEALEKAKDENKPIFLSIGYAACHWCHVMAHESFEDSQTAAILNKNFISIKVDREERPDLDDIYMQAVVTITGQGGWPLSVFLTPDLYPFYGGTYFPPQPRYGMPSFQQVLQSISDLWQNNPEKARQNAHALSNAIQKQVIKLPDDEIKFDLEKPIKRLTQNYDWDKGGWGSAPKFPQPMVIDFLIQKANQSNPQLISLVNDVLENMAQGGLFDLVGGGFHRYSTDSSWLVPHFEKMLYDNAQLALTYTHGYIVSGNQYLKDISIKTLEFINNELTLSGGGFASSLDADTAEGEGRYYSWSKKELEAQLSIDQFEFLQTIMSISESGNFEDNLNILRFKQPLPNLAESLGIPVASIQRQFEPIINILGKFRSKRVKPGIDDKVITAWNAYTIRAFAKAGLYYQRKDLIEIAINAADFIQNNLILKDSQLLRSWREGTAGPRGTLEDYASMIIAFHALYEINFDEKYYKLMVELYGSMIKEFEAPHSLYFDSSNQVSDLIFRPQSLQDNATPSGNALAAHVHWLLFNMEDDYSQYEKFNAMAENINQNAMQYPTAFGYWLQVIDLFLQPDQQVALVTQQSLDTLNDFLNSYRKKYRPNSIIAAKTRGNPGQTPAILKDRPAINNQPTAYVCKNFTCKMPTTDVHQFESEINAP